MNTETSDLAMPFEQRYQILSSIGKGGMGEVFTAKDNLLKREIALKLIHEQLSHSNSVRQCFNREARAFSLLHHPNIVEIYDFGLTQKEQIYIATEKIFGISLHDLFKVKLSIKTTFNLITQLLDALNYTHAKGLIHCDIKAENVLIFLKNDTLTAKITDFGLVCLPSAMDSQIDTEIRQGTPAYMAPEQILNQSSLVGPQTDIYAVGVLLYEMLTGHLPYSYPTPTETLQAHLNQPVPKIEWMPHYETLSPNIKTQISKILSIALAKKTWQRFMSAAEFKQELLSIPLPDEETHLDNTIIEQLKPSIQNTEKSNDNIEYSNHNSIIAKIRAVEENDVKDERLASQSLSFAARRLIFQDETGERYKFPDNISEVLEPSGFASIMAENFDSDTYSEDPDNHPAGERQKEYDLLKKYALRTLHGQGAFCIVSGRFGTGKTRLLRVFSEKMIQKKLCMFITACTVPASYKSSKEAKSEDYSQFLISGLLKQLSVQTYIDNGITFTIRDSLIKENLWRQEDDETLEKIQEKFDLNAQYTTPVKPDEELTQQALILLSKMIQEAACISPVCLMIDDLQRCDFTIWRWMLHIHAVTQNLPLFALVGYDPGELSGPRFKFNPRKVQEFSPLFSHTLTLNALSDQTIIQMLKNSWHIDPELGKRIAEVSYGNPYYAVARIQHLGQTGRLQKNRQKLFCLSPDDKRPLGVPNVVIQFFQQKLDDISNTIGTESDLYREILTRLSVFGFEMSMSELEAFWHQESDHALTDCWREAIASWCEHGILTMIRKPQSETRIQFTEPWHVEIIQSMLNASQLKNLHLQAALSLIDCYENPTMTQAWQIAMLMEKANETATFFQYFQLTIETAYREAQLSYGFTCIQYMLQVLKVCTSPIPQDIVCAIDWPNTLSLCADICLRLDEYDTFEFIDKLLEFLISDKNLSEAVHQSLQARYFLRRNQLQRSMDAAEKAADIFEKCNEDAEAAKVRWLKAQACMQTGNYPETRQLCNKARSVLLAQNSFWEVAQIEMALSIPDWYSAQTKQAERHLQQALKLFKQSRTRLGLLECQIYQDMICLFQSMDAQILTRIKQNLEILAAQGDLKTLANMRVYSYIACALTNQWLEIEEAQELYSDVENIGLHDNVVKSTVACLLAMKRALAGAYSKAQSDITMLIASFGPQNRRARAWCHTMLGMISIMSKQLESGKQSFERAEKDFQMLEDQFGLLTVEIAQCALVVNCHQDAVLWPMALDTLLHAKTSPWPVMSTIAQILFIYTATLTKQPASELSVLESEHPIVLPDFFRPICIDILADAIAWYQDDKPEETQYLFQLYEAISPEASLDMEDDDLPEVDIF